VTERLLVKGLAGREVAREMAGHESIPVPRFRGENTAVRRGNDVGVRFQGFPLPGLHGNELAHIDFVFEAIQQRE